MAELPNLLTYQDAIDHLITKEQSSREHQLLRMAIKYCYETDLPQKAPGGKWKYYLKEHDQRLEALYDTGTITYDHTGGASERLLTFSTALTGNPLDNLIYYRIRIDSVNYAISTKLSSTTAQLSVDNNPGENVASGTSFQLYRNRYTLPPDFQSMFPPLNEDVWAQYYLPVQDFQQLERQIWRQSDEPFRFTILPDPNVVGQMAIGFADIPSADGSVRFLYYRMPRQLKFHGYEEDILATTCTGTAATNTVTTSSAIGTSDWAGRFIRFYDTSNHPTGLAGRYPYKEQRSISSVSGTTVTLGENLDNTFGAGTKYRIVDPIDIRPTMNLALLRGAEYQLDCLLNRDAQASYQKYVEAVRTAGESDSVSEHIQQRWSIYRNRGFTSSPVVTVS